jgi:hypothetical protein
VTAFLLLLCAACMCSAFFLKHAVAVGEDSHWFKLMAGTPILLARAGTEGLVRRHYLGETALPWLHPSAALILLILAMQLAVLGAVVPAETNFRLPAVTDVQPPPRDSRP